MIPHALRVRCWASHGAPAPGQTSAPNDPSGTRCGDYGEPLPLQNLGSLAQPCRGGEPVQGGSTRRSASLFLLRISLPNARVSLPERVGILAGDDAPGKIQCLRVAAALGKRRAVCWVTQDAQ